MQLKRTRASHWAAFTFVKGPRLDNLYYIHGSEVSKRSLLLSGGAFTGEAK